MAAQVIELAEAPRGPVLAETTLPRTGYSYHALVNSKFRRPEAVIPNLLYEGHSAIFAGAFGQGKTFFGLQLSIALAAGKDFLGRKIRSPYRTVFFDAENGKGEIKDRVRDLVEVLKLSQEELQLLDKNWRLEDFEDEGDLHWLDLGTAEGFKRLGNYVTTYEPEVFIFDCFGRVYREEETKEGQLKTFLDHLKRLMISHKSLNSGLALFLHHTRKFAADQAEYNLLDHPSEFLAKVRGNGRLLDFVQGRIAMEQVNLPETHYVVNGIARSGQVEPLVLQRTTSGFFELHDDKALVEKQIFAKRPRQKELFASIKETFPKGRRFTFSQVQTTLRNSEGKPYNNQTIADTLHNGCGNGLIVHYPDEAYELAA